MKKQPKKSQKKISSPSQKTRRKLGMYGDRIRMADDFNAPLPDEILDAFEGKTENEHGKRGSTPTSS